MGKSGKQYREKQERIQNQRNKKQSTRFSNESKPDNRPGKRAA